MSAVCHAMLEQSSHEVPSVSPAIIPPRIQQNDQHDQTDTAEATAAIGYSRLPNSSTSTMAAQCRAGVCDQTALPDQGHSHHGARQFVGRARLALNLPFLLGRSLMHLLDHGSACIGQRDHPERGKRDDGQYS